MARIYVTRKIPSAGIDLLRSAGFEVDISEKDGVLTKDELIAALRAQQYDGILSLLTDTIDAAVLEAAPNAKIVSNYAVGYNNIDVKAAAARGVAVTNTPGVLTDTVVEYTLALMLAVAKRIPEADRFARAGKYEGWEPELFLGLDLKDKTLGILGAGRIGAEVAVRAQKGFGMKVAYYDVKQNGALEKEISCTYCSDIDEVLRQADVVSVHVPLLDSTHHLLNAERLSSMKQTAILINTSRGPVIDEAALVAALKDGTIRAAGIDVFENEPAFAPGLAELQNVVITPHIASASERTRAKMSEMAAQSIIDLFAGKTPEHIVRA
jgi:glyoxylate reductase